MPAGGGLGVEHAVDAHDRVAGCVEAQDGVAVYLQAQAAIGYEERPFFIGRHHPQPAQRSHPERDLAERSCGGDLLGEAHHPAGGEKLEHRTGRLDNVAEGRLLAARDSHVEGPREWGGAQ